MGVSPRLRHVRNFAASLVPKLKQHALKQLKVAAMNALEPEYLGEGKRRARPHPLKFKM
jgi:hypothetical protein